MADHLRTQIRHYVAATTLGITVPNILSRVYVNKTDPFDPAVDVPGLLLMGGDDRVMSRSEGSLAANVHRQEMHTTVLRIIAKAKNTAASGVDDLLDTICKDVKKRMCADRFLGGLSDDVRHLSDGEPQFDSTGDQTIGTVEMQYEIDYWCNEITPDVKG